MPYNDRKVRKSRSSGWTQEDERRWRAQQRREAERQRKEAAKRKAMLDGMGTEERQAFLDAEQERKDREDAEAAARQERYKAQRIELREQMADEARSTAGYLQSELAAAIGWKDAHGCDDGDWIDDPVAAMMGDGGFGEEVRTSKGIKLQVNICLDISNSMYHNGLADIAVETVRTLYLSLYTASRELPDDSLVVNLWTWAGGETGKGVRWLTDPSFGFGEFVNPFEDDDNPLGTAVDALPKYQSRWTGEDTWMYPLLKKLEKWEDMHGDFGAHRLDLIISDGVLEHPTDARKGDIIQDRRDGTLQSVVLNFLPMEEWGDYRVPNRCVQYPADNDNLFALIRQILGDWLVSI